MTRATITHRTANSRKSKLAKDSSLPASTAKCKSVSTNNNPNKQLKTLIIAMIIILITKKTKAVHQLHHCTSDMFSP